jgi:hypothetical protein
MLVHGAPYQSAPLRHTSPAPGTADSRVPVPAQGSAIIAFLIARGSTRALLAAPVAAAVLLLISIPHIISDLGHPGNVIDFAWTLIALPLVISAAAVAFAAWRARR